VRVRELTGTMEVDGQFFQERVVMPTEFFLLLALVVVSTSS